MRRDPRVSAIIIFLDEERFLEEAIESVFQQSYADWELLLVDDGSTDASSDIARRYAAAHPDRVRYLEHDGHANRGMSASRNLGIAHARGEFIAWLDGDDVWLPRKLERQVALADRHPEAAMVYGPLQVWYGWTGEPADRQRDFVQPLGFSANSLIPPPDLLIGFLRDDLHTPGGELVRRSVLEEVGGFNADFRGMYEDGVVHARICLRHPVFAAGECWYRYRQHPDSCCNQSIAAGTDRRARHAYLLWLRDYLREQGRDSGELWQIVRSLLRADDAGWVSRARAAGDASLRRGLRSARQVADRTVPGFIRSAFGLIAFRGRGVPPAGWLHLGNLRRLTPISRMFGFDRGLPIDRHYIEQFLAGHASDVRGHVMEVADATYTRRFGGDRVTTADVLHVREGNPEATRVGDLCTGVGIPEAEYDCVILTQVLPFLWDFRAAIGNLHRALRPGGVALVTLPGITQVSRFDADRWGDYWRFTSMAADRLFREAFVDGEVEVVAHGNVLAATAFLHGIAAAELREEELRYRDPDYEVTITVRAVRAPVRGGPGPDAP
jgi:glycosyltransferase involved in cell wall biosynthesis